MPQDATSVNVIQDTSDPSMWMTWHAGSTVSRGDQPIWQASVPHWHAAVLCNICAGRAAPHNQLGIGVAVLQHAVLGVQWQVSRCAGTASQHLFSCRVSPGADAVGPTQVAHQNSTSGPRVCEGSAHRVLCQAAVQRGGHRRAVQVNLQSLHCLISTCIRGGARQQKSLRQFMYSTDFQ